MPLSSDDDNHDDDLLWRNAAIVAAACTDNDFAADSILLQVVGLDATPPTLFVRQRRRRTVMQQETILDAIQTVLKYQRVHRQRKQQHQNVGGGHHSYYTAMELFQLGAVWIHLPDYSGSENGTEGKRKKAAWRRVKVEESSHSEFTSDAVLRLHSQPSRYPIEQWKRSLRSDEEGEDEDPFLLYHHQHTTTARGETSPHYMIINKPGGIPAHPSVDNGIENVLSVVQQDEIKMLFGTAATTAANLVAPHRLDVDTCGLQVVSTPQFSAYFGKLLEQKTTTQNNGSILEKRYKCVVEIPSRDLHATLQDYRRNSTTITHFTNKQGPCPKRFVVEEVTLMDHGHHNESNTDWVECRLRILSVGTLLLKSEGVAGLSGCSTNNSSEPIQPYPFLTELTIDLLTGRTHQIRGQLSELGCPIVGDALYNGNYSARKYTNEMYHTNVSKQPSSSPPAPCHPEIHYSSFPKMRRFNAMALQCCYLSFELPKIDTGYDKSDAIEGSLDVATSTKNPLTKKERKLLKRQFQKQRRDKGRTVLVGSGKMVTYELNTAWWSKVLLDSTEAAVDVRG